MLVLSRKVGEVIEIGGGVSVTVREIQGQRVRIGIAAPANISILRRELCFDLANGTGVAEEVNDLHDRRTVSHVTKSR